MDEKSEMDLCTSDEHVIANMYKLVLKMNMVDKSVKDWMIKCTKKIRHNIMLDQWENIWSKGLKFILNYNLKENIF